jgi:putative flippase GtrA
VRLPRQGGGSQYVRLPLRPERGQETPHPMTRFLRYTTIGACATAAHYLAMTALVEWARVPAWIASGIGAAIGAQLAFFGNRRFTFEHAGEGLPAWFKFMATALLGALLGMAIVALGVAWGWHYLAAQVLATLCGLVLTYAVNRRWTFT